MYLLHVLYVGWYVSLGHVLPHTTYVAVLLWVVHVALLIAAARRVLSYPPCTHGMGAVRGWQGGHKRHPYSSLGFGFSKMKHIFCFVFSSKVQSCVTFLDVLFEH